MPNKKVRHKEKDIDVETIDTSIPAFPGQTSLISLTLTVLKDRQTTIEYAKQTGLINTRKFCPSCKQLMPVRPTSTDVNVGVAFACRKIRCKKFFSCRTGTFTEHASIPLEKIIALIYCFSAQYSVDHTIKETSYFGGKTSTETVADWFSYCRQVCVTYMDTLKFSSDYQIGGPGLTVEIDETLVGKCRYGSERLTEGTWAIGGYCRETSDVFIELCPNNGTSSGELLPVIEKRVRLGSRIITSEWKAYQSLPPSAYTHQMVNHSKNFVDPETEGPTQIMRGLWCHLKKCLRHRYRDTQHLAEHLCEFLWRRHLKKRPFADAYSALMEDIQLLYPARKAQVASKPKQKTMTNNKLQPSTSHRDSTT